MADQVLYSGVACITDLMVKEGLINLDFADVRSVMREMGKAMMGTGEASGEGRAMAAAEAAIANPLLDETSMKRRQGPADLDHRRPRPHPLRGRRGSHPHPRGSRPGRQHHPRRAPSTRNSKASSASRWSPPASTRRPTRSPPRRSRCASSAASRSAPQQQRPGRDCARSSRRRSRCTVATDPVADAIRQAEINAAVMAARPAPAAGRRLPAGQQAVPAAAGPAAAAAAGHASSVPRPVAQPQPTAGRSAPHAEGRGPPPVVRAEVEARRARSRPSTMRATARWACSSA